MPSNTELIWTRFLIDLFSFFEYLQFRRVARDLIIHFVVANFWKQSCWPIYIHILLVGFFCGHLNKINQIHVVQIKEGVRRGNGGRVPELSNDEWMREVRDSISNLDSDSKIRRCRWLTLTCWLLVYSLLVYFVLLVCNKIVTLPVDIVWLDQMQWIVHAEWFFS